MKKLLTVNEVACVLKIKKSTAYQIMHSHGFPLIRIRHSMRVSEDALQQWLREQEKKGP